MTPLLTKIAIGSASIAGVTVIGAGTAYLTSPSKPANQQHKKLIKKIVIQQQVNLFQIDWMVKI